MSLPADYVLPGHVCRPWPNSGYRAHDAPDGIVYECPCGARWRAVHRHLGTDPRPCECGWERTG